MGDLLKQVSDALVEGQAARVKELVEAALKAGWPAEEVLDCGLMLGLATVAQQFDGNIVYIPEVLLACRAMHAGMRVLRPVLGASGARHRGRVVIGTVAGDLHDIGKALAITFMESQGIEVVDLGVDVHPDEFALAVKEYRPEVLAMSALLSTSVPMIGTTLRALEQAGVRDRVKVLVGGAPVGPEYARSVGAEFYAPDARVGARMIRDWLLSGSPR